MAFQIPSPRPSANEEPITGIIQTLDALEHTLSDLEFDVRNELSSQRLLAQCQLNLASKCQDATCDPSTLECHQNKDSDSLGTKFGTECNCRCNQALRIYLEHLRQAQLEQEALLRKLKMKDEQVALYRSKLLEANATVERQKHEILMFKENEELITHKINAALEEENQKLLSEIDRLKRLPDELRERERSLKFANKELQETKLTLKSLLLDIESGLEACEDISGELQQERKRAFRTLNEIDDEKRKVMSWVAKYTELKQQYDVAVNQKESVDQLSVTLRDKSYKLEQLTQEYEALKEESVGYIAKVETQNEKQRAELQERMLELECENLRLKIALQDQSQKTSDASHNMQRELANLEQKFVEAQTEIQTMKRFNEAAAAAAEYGSRRKTAPEVGDELQPLTPPYCSVCAVEDTSKCSGGNTCDFVANAGSTGIGSESTKVTGNDSNKSQGSTGQNDSVIER